MYSEMNNIIVRKWLENKINNKNWAEYLCTYSYQKIAIYGVDELAQLLEMELRNTQIICTTFIIDEISESVLDKGTRIMTLRNFLAEENEADAIIVTSPNEYEKVLTFVLKNRPELPVMSLRDMIYEM